MEAGVNTFQPNCAVSGWAGTKRAGLRANRVFIGIRPTLAKRQLSLKKYRSNSLPLLYQWLHWARSRSLPCHSWARSSFYSTWVHVSLNPLAISNGDIQTGYSSLF